MIAAAIFTREEIEDQGLAAAQRLVILAAAVREAGIAPLGEDHARVFQVVVQQNAADETAQSADGQRPAGIICDQVVPGAMAGDEIPGRAQGGVGARGDAADALQLVRIARHGRLVEERHAALAAELVALQCLQLRQQLDQILRGRCAIDADAPGRHVQPLQGPAPQAGQRSRSLAFGFLQQLRPVQLLPADGLQSAAARLLDFHRVDDHHRRRAAQLDDQSAGHPRTVAQIVALRAVEFVAYDDDGLQFAPGHQAIQICFHLLTCLRSYGAQSIVFACECQPA